MLKYLTILSLATISLYSEKVNIEETIHPEWCQSFKKSEILYQEKTDFQDLVIFENPLFGKGLMLDGIIQNTQADEAVYHEMMTHVPLLSHANPKHVLIIGGGDGGILREVLKHPSVEQATIVDIDKSVINFSKKYLPHLSNGAFDDPRARIIIQDAALFVKETEEKFDIIICDSTDPIGPGEVLFTSEFYGNCNRVLNEDGIFVNQNGVPFMQPTELALTAKNKAPHFKHVEFYIAPVPTYVGGHMAFGWASNKKYRVSQKKLKCRLAKVSKDLYYYTPRVHKAAFALPKFMQKQLDK
jgi:spermidine synthase